MENIGQAVIIQFMKNSRVKEEKVENKSLEKLPFEARLQISLKSITKLLLFVEFAVNYGYAIENAWVTMLMITHKTSDEVDSFVWIIPIILGILIRPYIVRYVHQVTYKVYREVSLVSLFMVLGAIGCYIVGLSCDMQGKSRLFRRIFTCTVGWTIMGISFQFCQFFAAKIEEGFEQMREQQKEEDVERNQTFFGKKENLSLFGLLLGYIVCIAICWIVQGKSVKEFYRCCKYAYWTVGGLALITGIRLFAESSSKMPQKTEVQEKQNSSNPLSLVGQASFYLPGLLELVRSDRKSFLMLLLHGAIVFQNDVVTIYCTMWFTEPDNFKFKKYGEALVTGIYFGSIALLLYTIIDAFKTKARFFHSGKTFSASFIVMMIISLYSFWIYDYLSFFFVCASVGIVNLLYRNVVYDDEIESNPIFERCAQIVERMQKIFILSVMPSIVLLLLERDDVRDCLAWSAGISVIGLILFYLSQKVDSSKQTEAKSSSGTVKVTKIQ